MQDKWDLLAKYSEHFELTSQTANDYVSGVHALNTHVFTYVFYLRRSNCRHFDCVIHFRVESSKTTATDKTRKAEETLRLHAEKPQLVTLFFLLGDMRELGSDVVPGFSPCWDHIIHVIQSRDVPLDPKDVKILHKALFFVISHNFHLFYLS